MHRPIEMTRGNGEHVPARLRLAASGAARLIRGLGSTWRIRVEGWDNVERARRVAPYLVFAFWHGHMLALSYTFRNRNVQLLASRHRDGELMGQIVRRLGYGHVRGSSTRGGARAIRVLARHIREGHDIGLTVDGPVGPRHVFKPGPIEIARLSGSMVIPLAAAARSRWVLRSWDRFEVPKPFTVVKAAFGEAIAVPVDADAQTVEAKRLEAEKRLRELTERNDDSLRR